jgi:G3E family GTPase
LTEFLTDYGVIIALACAAAAIVYGAVITSRLLRLSAGNERMREISGAVQEGAQAYLRRQYSIIAAPRETGAYVLDGVVSVIDVENWKGYEDTSYTAKIQARYTDLIVFNKWETAGEDRYDECLDRVADLDVDVAKVKADKGWLPMDVVFGVDGGLARELTESEVEGGNHHDHADGEKHSHNHQSEVEVLSLEIKGDTGASVSTDKLTAFLSSTPKDEVYRIKAVLTLSSTPKNSDPDVPQPEATDSRRYILNWAFGRWTFTPIATQVAEHDSSNDLTTRMTVITGRYESNKWKKKLEAGGLVELDGVNKGELVVTRIL